MSQPDFKTAPLAYIYARLAEVESELMDIMNDDIHNPDSLLDQVRELLDLIRPVITIDKTGLP